MWPDDLYWHPVLLYLAAGLFVLPFLMVIMAYYRHRRLWQRFADVHLLHWIKYRPSKTVQPVVKLVLLVMAWLLFCLALAGPRTIRWLPPSLQQETAHIQVLVDFSQSMRAVDTGRNRIQQAHDMLQFWIEQLPRNSKLGISLFAGQAHTLLIPTHDQVLLRYFNQQLPYLKPPVNGNNLDRAIEKAHKILSGHLNNAYLVILSDGDMDDSSLEKALKRLQLLAASGQSVKKLLIIGLGGDEAVTIPYKANQFLSDNGQLVVSRRHDDNLATLAETVRGQYYPFEKLDNTLDLKDLLALPSPEVPDKDSHKVQWQEWFFIPLLSACVLLLLALGYKRPAFDKILAISLLLILTACDRSDISHRTLVNDKAPYNSIEKTIDKALNKQQYKQVMALTKKISDKDKTPYIRFAQGVACYRLRDFICAQQNFAWSAWHETDPVLKAQAVFNLANSHFYLGDYEQALILYQDARQQGIATEKLRINIEFAHALSQAIRQTIADMDKTQQRAQWRSATSRLTEKYTDKLADGIFLPGFNTLKNNPLFKQLPLQEQKKLLAQGIKFHLYKGSIQTLPDQNAWVLSRQEKTSDTTAELYNQLMAYETGLHYVPEQALDKEGQRSW